MQNIDSTTKIRKNAIKLLNAVGVEENFNITYILMSKKLGKRSVKLIIIIFIPLSLFFSDEIGLIVQLALTPLLVFTGNGKSIAEAQEMAAYVALSYIKLLLQK